MTPARAAFSAFAFLLGCLAAPPAAAQAERAGRGLWIGPIPACAGTVATVRVRAGEAAGDQLTAIVTFRPAWRAILLRETGRRIDRPMPVRLDGRMLMAPYVREPIAGGVIALSSLTAPEAERIRAAARRPCPRGAR